MPMPIARAVAAQTIGDSNHAVSVPNSVGMALAFGVEQLPNAWLTCDELRLQSTDVIADDDMPGLAEFAAGYAPEAVERKMGSYKGGKYADWAQRWREMDAAAG